MKRSRSSKLPVNAATGSSIFSIPSCLLMEILSKLPMSTICNCRCVCSYFRNLISDPQFAQLHLSTSQPSLMFWDRRWDCIVHLIELIHPCLDPVGANNRYAPRILRFKPKCDVPTAELEVLSSCNGLICFYWPRTYNPYVICNPVINEHVIVPQMEKVFFDQCGSGFGFCSRTNQYKMLRLLSPSIGFGVPGLIKLEAEINTVGTNLWRRVGDAPRYLHWYSGGCFLNGSLHWIVHDTENCFESMCCFDFGKERFQPFPGPSQFRGLPGQLRVEMMKMGVLKDGLSVFHHPNCYMLDIWVMKDYAVRESWTKDFVIKLPWVATYFGYIYQPLMVLNNGVILMVYALSVLLSCNTMDNNSFRKFMVNGISSFARAMTYIPSFVSIKNAARGSYS
ncbi:hypothetical protein RHSIM_Rhsim04G0041900 [Rhododendron simsii]|uniref:F-box domain-containing protein n=1 Tax=Rhododendron simsii TaxID=118357 RepID=A0A834H5M0_RHOSS|nr:hypothetical protein RHSIM_Rhsim04G0041900 [Rhododendron simsii]